MRAVNPSQRHRPDWQQDPEENFSNLRRDTPTQIKEPHRKQNGQDQKRKFPWHIIFKTLIYRTKKG